MDAYAAKGTARRGLSLILPGNSASRKHMPSWERLRELSGKLPGVRDWIEDTVASYQSRATPVAELDLPHLGRYFSAELLQEAKTVHLTDLPPLPPLHEIGEEASESEEPVIYEAVTYGDTIFLGEKLQSEVLYFHELVHVIQWNRLGKENFLFAYVAGLLDFGYRSNPLEKIAFGLQEKFRQGNLSADVAGSIRKHSDTIWQRTFDSAIP